MCGVTNIHRIIFIDRVFANSKIIMARIILHWLNDEVKLSHEITSLSEDFKNGYLLGELLHKYNQQHHFDKFIDRETPDAKIANFCLLEPTMRQIGVHFNSQVAYDVMNAKPGAMKTLLYEIRTVLESAKSMSKSADAHQMKRVMRIIKPSIPEYDKTMSVTFENAIRAMVENPNDILMEHATNRFSKMTESFHDDLTRSYSQQMSEMRYELKRTKEIEKEKRRHEKEFRATWDQMNKDQWRKNQLIARDRRCLSQTVNAAAQHRETARKVLANTSARETAINSIADFEERIADMRRKGDNGGGTSLLALKTVGSVDDGSGVPALTYLDEDTLRKGMVQNQREMQDRNQKLHQRQMDRDRRRKRFVRLKESHNAALLQMEAEGEIFTRVLTTSELEEVEKLAKFRIMVYKDLFVQNAHTRQDLLVQRKQEYAEYLNRCAEYDADVELSWVVTNRVLSQVARLDALEEAKTAAYKQESIETVWREIDRLLDITDWIVNMRALGSYSGGTELPRVKSDTDADGREPSMLLPQAILSDVSCMYTAETLLAPTALPTPHQVNVHDDLPLSLSWRPAVPVVDWLLRHPFGGGDFMTDAGGDSAYGDSPRGDIDDSDAAENTAEKAEASHVNPDVTPSNSITSSRMSNYLMHYDSDCFIASIAAFEPPPVDDGTVAGKAGKGDKKKDAGGTATKKGKNEAEEEVETGIKIIPPTWIAATPPATLLGEVIVATRCVANPIPAHPTAPADVPVFPLRLVLCGTSSAVKKSISSALEMEFGVKVLRVDDLVSDAVALGEHLALHSDDKTFSALESVSLHVSGTCQRGYPVDDDSYVTLLVETIRAMEADSVGYVIEDFPNTREQAVKLVTALSGVDYDSHMPQVGDKTSPFLTNIPRENEWFDPIKCGLDRAFFITVPPSVSTRDRICLRKDRRTGDIVSLSESTKSVETLAEIVSPRHAMDTISLHVATAAHASVAMQKYLDNLGIVSCLHAEGSSDMNVLESVIENVRKLLPTAERPPVTLPSEEVVAEISADVAPGADSENSFPSATTLPVVVFQEGTLPPRLSRILADVWEAGERQTRASSEQFFSSMRELHYHTIQRRGAIRQVVVTQTLQRDNKQDIFDAFREDFNSFENDFRFDAELMNELYLRTLELRDQFWDISESKAANTKKVIQKISRDEMEKVFIHQARCEGASLLQSYLGLFVAGLNVLFDYMRATSAYGYTRAYGQVLETIGPAINPSLQTDYEGGKGAKDKSKKNKASTDTSSRIPVAPPILWSDMEQVPSSSAEDEAEEDKGSKKKDAKKVGLAFLTSLYLSNVVLLSTNAELSVYPVLSSLTSSVYRIRKARVQLVTHIVYPLRTLSLSATVGLKVLFQWIETHTGEMITSPSPLRMLYG